MAKEQTGLETMQSFDDEALKPAAAKAAQQEETRQAPEPKAGEEKPKAAKKAAAGFKNIRYTGKNPSYTIGRHRFRQGDVLSVEKELAEYALTQRIFEEV